MPKKPKNCEKMRQMRTKTQFDAPKPSCIHPSAGCAKPNLKELRSVNPLGETEGTTSNTRRGRRPPRIVTPSELAEQRGGRRNRQNLSEFPCPRFAEKLKKSSQILPKPSPNPPQSLPESSQNPSKIDPKGLLDSILDLCLKKG